MLKVAYRYDKSVFKEDDIKLLNFNTVIEKFHGSMRHPLKQIYSSCNGISPGLLKSDPHLQKKKLLDLMIPFKKDEKCFSFHRKSSFYSQDI